MSIIDKAKKQKTMKKKHINSCRGRIKKKTRGQWLSTPQAWAEFDEWVKLRAQPKKLLCPEPINRCKKPLECMIDHLCCLSRPKRNFGKNQCTLKVLCGNTLNFKPTKRLKDLAVPRCRRGPRCREWGVIHSALCYDASERIICLSQKKKRAGPSDCKPRRLRRVPSTYRTSEQTEILAKPKKYIDSMCLERKINNAQPRPLSEWVEFLALPSYKHLKDQETENAKKLKLKILNEIEVRGKIALEEQMFKRGETTLYEQKNDYEIKETKEMKKLKRVNKDPWRFTDSTCRQFPPPISPFALKYNASTATIKLSKPKIRNNESCLTISPKKNEHPKPASAYPRLESLATPKFVCEPVKRDPPREHDEFGKPIIKIPKYGRELPEPKPYLTLTDCKLIHEKIKEKCKNKKLKEQELMNSRSIDSIANQPTIDPLFDPVGARKQARERKLAAQMNKLQVNNEANLKNEHE